MDLTLNLLPTKTWNRLGMNRTAVKAEGEFENFVPEAEGLSEQAAFETGAQELSVPAMPDRGSDLDQLTKAAQTARVQVTAGKSMEKPLVLRYAYPAGSRAASRLILHAEKDAVLSVILVFTGNPEAAALRTEILAEENARVQVYTAQLLEGGKCLQQMDGVCMNGAKAELTRLELGASESYSDVNLDLMGAESALTANTAYHALPGQVMDMNYVARHHGRNSQSLMEVTGTLEENSRKIFRGTIDFCNGCKGATGTENEHVLLMGDSMVNQTIPLILCDEEDVEGNHGATIGQLDERMLFYLGTRGISEDAARQILARARIASVCSLFPEETVREQAMNFEEQRGS